MPGWGSPRRRSSREHRAHCSEQNSNCSKQIPTNRLETASLDSPVLVVTEGLEASIPLGITAGHLSTCQDIKQLNAHTWSSPPLWKEENCSQHSWTLLVPGIDTLRAFSYRLSPAGSWQPSRASKAAIRQCQWPHLPRLTPQSPAHGITRLRPPWQEQDFHSLREQREL